MSNYSENFEYVEKESFPDLGLKPLKGKERQLARQAVGNMIEQIKKPNNQDQFLASTREMFTTFGIKEDPLQEPWNSEHLAAVYQEWHQRLEERKGGGFYVDIELRTQKKGYANIYLFRDFYPKDAIRVLPGACSQGSTRPAYIEFLPVKDFDQAFMSAVGVKEDWMEGLPKEKRKLFC